MSETVPCESSDTLKPKAMVFMDIDQSKYTDQQPIKASMVLYTSAGQAKEKGYQQSISLDRCVFDQREVGKKNFGCQ